MTAMGEGNGGEYLPITVHIALHFSARGRNDAFWQNWRNTGLSGRWRTYCLLYFRSAGGACARRSN